MGVKISVEEITPIMSIEGQSYVIFVSQSGLKLPDPGTHSHEREEASR